MSIIQSIFELLERIGSGEITLEDAAIIVKKNKVNFMLDEKTIYLLIESSFKTENQSPLSSYCMSYLTYELVKNDHFKVSRARAHAANTLANFSLNMGRFKSAMELYKESINIFEEHKDKYGIGSATGNLGHCFRVKGELQKAIECYMKSLNIAKEIKDKNMEGTGISNLANTYLILGENHKSIDYFEKALEIAKNDGDRKSEGERFGSLGMPYFALGKFRLAERNFEGALEIAREIGDIIGESRWLLNLGNVFRSLGHYQKAISSYEKCLSIAKETYKSAEVNCLSNLGNVFHLLGNYDKAIWYLETALKIAREIGDRNEECACLGNIGNIYRIQEEHDNSISNYKKAIKIANEIGYRILEGIYLGNLGAAYHSVNQNNEAIIHIKKSLKIAKEIGDKQGKAIRYCELGKVYRTINQFEESIICFEKALNYAKEIGDIDNERNICLNLGILYDRFLINPKKSFDYYKKSIALSELMRGRLVEETHKFGFTGRILEAYDRMILLCSRLNKMEDAFEYAEKAKSRVFLDMLALTEFKSNSKVPFELMQKEEEYLELLRQVQRKASEETTHIPPLDISKISYNLESIYDSIEKYDHKYVSLRRGKTPNLFQFQKLLKNQHKRIGVVEYYIAEGKLIIFVFNSSESKLYLKEILLKNEKIHILISNYWKEVAQYGQFGNIKQTWQKFSQYLIDPISAYLTNVDLIYIIPHGFLHYIPFHALVHKSSFLIESFQIVYSPSASLINYCLAKPKKTQESCLSLGVVFEEEAEIVARLFNSQAYKGSEVTKNLIRDESKNKDIIHFSCHGYFDQHQPINSGLVFHNQECLTVSDILNLRLNADLVTLSACETGFNEQKPGDELIGLTRSFIYSGASSVIVSLWKVDSESTLNLMEKFYTNLVKNKMSKVKALQKAQIDIMKTPGYEHPYYWAPFILVGDWR